MAGRAVTLTATPTTASGTLTGDVEFREGTTLLGILTLSGATSVLELTGVDPGSHDYRATFVPSGSSHTGSTSPIATATVAKVATTTGLTAAVSRSFGDPDRHSHRVRRHPHGLGRVP